MSRLIAFALSSLFAASVAFAQAATAASDCAAKAIGKNDRPLARAAKASFIRKCEADAATNAFGTVTFGVGTFGVIRSATDLPVAIPATALPAAAFSSLGAAAVAKGGK